MAIRNNEPVGNPVKITVEADTTIHPKGDRLANQLHSPGCPCFALKNAWNFPSLSQQKAIVFKVEHGSWLWQKLYDFPVNMVNTAMGSSEREMAKNCAEEVYVVKVGKLSIGAIVADGDSAIGNGIKEVCGTHRILNIKIIFRILWWHVTAPEMRPSSYGYRQLWGKSVVRLASTRE